VRLHVMKLQRLGCRDESGGRGYLQPAHAERKLNTCFGWRIAGMSASSIDVFRVANGISIRRVATYLCGATVARALGLSVIVQHL
jgi:hypothetical protein